LSGKPRETDAQKRWRPELNWREEWNRARKYTALPKRIRFWWMDALQINLATRYTKDKCSLCKDIIHSDHFIGKCSQRKNIIRKLNANIDVPEHNVIVNWCSWIMHTDLSHGEDKYKALGRAAKAINKIRD